MIFEILVLLVLIVLNGALALSELAVVSARPSRLRAMESKSRGAQMALHLARDPGRFLSTAQIGITAVGVLSGALSGATLGIRLADWLVTHGMGEEWAGRIGVGGVVVVITYVSLIIGELVPKQMALRNPEGIAIRVAPAMVVLSVAAAPLVWFLDESGKAVLWLLRQRGESGNTVTEEEVKVILAEAHEGGVLEDEERVMIAGVMRLSDRSARKLMTPRQEVEALPLDATSAEAVAAMRRIARSRMPVKDEAGDIVGIVLLTDVFQAVSRREQVDLKAILREVPVVNDRMEALDVIEVLLKSDDHMALVYDEYGHFEGVITTADVLGAITGAVASSEADEPALVKGANGSVTVAGWMPADEFCDRMKLPRKTAGDYDTVAGLILYQLGHLPARGEKVEVGDYQLEVLEIDGLRINKVLLTRIRSPGE